MNRSIRGGLSLVEILVALTIIVILVGLLMPATRRVHVAAGRMQCSNNLKQMALAFHSYAGAGYPTSAPLADRQAMHAVDTFPTGCFGLGATPEERLSWMVALLPYIEQQNLAKQFNVEKGYAGNLTPAQTKVKTYFCPESKETVANPTLTNYIAMAGIGSDAPAKPADAPGNGFMGYDRITSFALLKDGTSNTIALMETHANLGPWARGGASNVRGFAPNDVPLYGEQRPFFGHRGGSQAALADGSVRFISSTVSPKTLAAAITIAGGETLGSDW